MSGMLETATTWDDIELKKQLVTDAGQDGLLQVPVPVLFDPTEWSGHRTHNLTDAVDRKIVSEGCAAGGLVGAAACAGWSAPSRTGHCIPAPISTS